MTAPSDPVPPDFIEHLRTVLPDVARDMLADALRAVPVYRELSDETVHEELPRAAEANLRLFVQSLAESRVPREDELEDLVAIAVRRAREGIPLDNVLSVYHHGAAAAWKAVAAEANTPEQREKLLALVPYIIGYLGAVTPGVAGAYLRERQDLHWEQREAKRAVTQALVHGKRADLLAERFGISLAGGFHVVAFRLAEADGASVNGSRPVLRIAQSEVDALSGRALSALDRSGGVVLVPDIEGEAPVQLDAFVDRIATAVGVRAVAGIAFAANADEVAACAEEAAEIARLAQQLQRPSGVYRMADLALQYQLARPGPARNWLLSLLVPLQGQGHLLEALRAFIDHAYNRQDAAASLVVHRNTLNYRLNRIATITGYDPNRPDHAQLFAAALTAQDLDSTDS